MLNYDILIVGAGPAGSSAASEAAKYGAKVLLIEKKKIIGEPVQCAEFIPKLILSEVEISRDSIVQEIKGMRTHLPNGECVESYSPGYMLNRSIFDKELAMKAADSGVEVRINTLCSSKKKEKIFINKNGREIDVTAKVIIGADGPKSTVGKWINSVNRDFIIGMQYSVPLVSSLDFTEVYFDQDFFGGYGWLFPKGKSANVGVGIKYNSITKTDKSLSSILKKFVKVLEEDGKVKNSPFLITSGLIPVGGPLNTVKDNIMLVGDAAGQTHPITGGGIAQAVICGKIAGKIAACAIQKEDIEMLIDYEKEWKDIFGKELERAHTKRCFLESNWDKLDSIVKKCWTVFREYYYE
ncbi:MAG: NAD(P)/FAD-dependent oxidoreductase [Candidatus Infernicultor aquiphilus]|uniref:NAD(P)/FAD-dependent oxidoreductase n=1 Tax=Candidatus Infernicultor aquiphilus TaxID=1805029 RepID=A0A2M7PME6_9BACT|nr:MAG: NAD(P)/FAD-dependent oxidoreductase [Candidatus Atribacteria bacterium CG_4_10_14_3_um_filter_34_13]